MRVLDDRVALITGAARGIGRAIAERFAREGAALVVAGRGEAIESVADALRRRGGSVTAVRGDLADPAHAKQLVQACVETHDRLDVLVANAGILLPGLVGMTSVDSMREMLEVNVVAAMNLTQFAVRPMRRSSAGSVIHLGSIAGGRGLEGASAYSAAKAAIAGFTRAAAKELAPHGIRVNAIAPGFIDTEMTREMPERQREERLASIRIGRAGRPEEVADCALFLACDQSSYVTGQVIGVDGGMVA